jgi:hypothetical protein
VARLSVGLGDVLPRAGAPRAAGGSSPTSQGGGAALRGMLHDFGKVGVRENVLVRRTS